MGTVGTFQARCTVAGQAIDSLRWLKFAVIFGLIADLYWDVVRSMAVEWWTVSSSSYGMLIPPIALYIAYSRRAVTLAIPARSELRGLWLVTLACAMFFFGDLAAGFFLSRISLVVDAIREVGLGEAGKQFSGERCEHVDLS